MAPLTLLQRRWRTAAWSKVCLAPWRTDWRHRPWWEQERWSSTQNNIQRCSKMRYGYRGTSYLFRCSTWYLLSKLPHTHLNTLKVMKLPCLLPCPQYCTTVASYSLINNILVRFVPLAAQPSPPWTSWRNLVSALQWCKQWRLPPKDAKSWPGCDSMHLEVGPCSPKFYYRYCVSLRELRLLITITKCVMWLLEYLKINDLIL